MANKGYEILSEMRNSLVDEQVALTSRLNEMTAHIEEIDLFVQTLLADEDIDVKVFTPRNLESRHKEHLEQKHTEKENLEEQIRLTQNRRDVINEKIDQLDIVLHDYESMMNSQSLKKQVTENVSHETLLLSLLEDERARIANELHDDPVQQLTAIIHKTELCGRFIQQDPTRAQLELATITKSLRNLINETRRIIYNLRPLVLDDLGWNAAVRKMLQDMQQQTQQRISFMDCDIEVKAEELIQITSYRIVQEAVTNAIKHSNGNSIEISIAETEHDYIIKVFDNGQSFDIIQTNPEKKNFGLQVMKERTSLIHGTLDIEQTPGVGTLVKLTFPK